MIVSENQEKLIKIFLPLKMTLSEYAQLKQQTVFNVGKSENHHHLLHKLKEFYREDIDSERRFEQVNTIGQLLRILEVRDVLSEDNTAPLKEIARRLNNNELLRKISDYEMNHVPREYVNCYALQNNQPSIQKIKVTNCDNSLPFGNLSDIKTQRINDTIIDEIGKFWRDLARNLKIRECKIEEIDTKNQSLNEKAKELLNYYYESKADPQRWFYILCEALEKSRRKDLSKSIQEIMVMNI